MLYNTCNVLKRLSLLVVCLQPLQQLCCFLILSLFSSWKSGVSSGVETKVATNKPCWHVVSVFERWETLSLWLGRLRMEVCPIRWTYSSLPKTHGPPPFPVPAVWQSVFQVGSPRLTHEEALLIGSSGSFPNCLRDSVFYSTRTVFRKKGRTQLKHYTESRWSLPKSGKRDNCI